MITAKLTAAQRERLLARVRRLCFALRETTERLSHGEPSFFYRGKKQFLTFDTYHHGADRYAFWCAAPLGAQDTLVRSDPERFFVPPYVGHRGWVGVRLDRAPDWDGIARIIADAHAKVARR